MARDAVACADIVLIPVRPRAFDMQAIVTTVALVQGYRILAWIVFNGMPARAPRLLAGVTKGATDMGLPVCPHAITDRAAYYHGPEKGVTAGEHQPGGKAAAEIDVLWDWLSLQAAKLTS